LALRPIFEAVISRTLIFEVQSFKSRTLEMLTFEALTLKGQFLEELNYEARNFKEQIFRVLTFEKPIFVKQIFKMPIFEVPTFRVCILFMLIFRAPSSINQFHTIPGSRCLGGDGAIFPGGWAILIKVESFFVKSEQFLLKEPVRFLQMYYILNVKRS
jgi:hypothetical protein